MSTALVLVDLMPRIIALELAPHSGEEVLARGKLLANEFRVKGLPVVLVRVERPNVSEQPPGSGLADGLAQAGDVIVVKRSIGAFYNTDLPAELEKRAVSTLVIGGLITTMGVESTARAASDHGYDLEFVADAMADTSEEAHNFAVERTFPRFGAVRNAADYLESEHGQ